MRDAVVYSVVRPRPPVGDRAMYATGFAFPSGHTTSAVTAGLLVWALSRRMGPAVLRTSSVLLAGWAVTVGISRIYLGVHWTTDRPRRLALRPDLADGRDGADRAEVRATPRPHTPVATGRTAPAPDRSGREMTRDPEDARIVAAALPLVVRHGTSVTTSMIARAAGVRAEAVFKPFPEQAALLGACATEAVRPDEAVAAITAISLSRPLEARLASAAAVLRSHATRVRLLADIIPRFPGPTENSDGHTALHERELASLRRALTRLFEPERELLRLPPERLAPLFQSMVLASTLTGFPETQPTEDVVPLFLWGALTPP
ncbi:phosphatase PAP2 family protein [Streptomyces sp. NBC_00161]